MSTAAAMPRRAQVAEGSPGFEVMTGIEAVARILPLQHQLDSRNGLATAAMASGYPGSPLGGLDLALNRRSDYLSRLDVHHVPAVNEELAAAIVWGSQMEALTDAKRFDGVVGLWYGKGPGVDRCGDVFRHANSMGAAKHGGVLAVAGDDPAAKSSTLPCDSRSAFADVQFPVLAPSSVGEILELGLHGIALSRYSGLWVGLKVVTDLADGFVSTVQDDLVPSPVTPELELDGRLWEHRQVPALSNVVSVRQEGEILNGRLAAARAYALANDLNAVSHGSNDDWLGIVASGTAHRDLLEALARLGLPPETLGDRGIRVLKVGMPYPLEPTAVREFAEGLREILVVEEKRPFLETLVRDALYGHQWTPPVSGKRDEHGRPLVPADGDITPDRLVSVLLARLGDELQLTPPQLTTPEAGPANGRTWELPVVEESIPRRPPAFCSGCPHNKSTAGVPGSVIGGGVGCHAIVYLEERHDEDVLLPLTPMGAEGVPWIGLSPFTESDHVSQNLGDGTFSHSGSLAVRACVAADVNITFKILFNSVVAMTGAQEVAGGASVPALTRQLEALGVGRIIVVADDPSRYPRRARFAPGVKVWPRTRLTEAEAALAEHPGVTALVYDEECAANARRSWKRGQRPEPSTRVFINEAVCEGCGDCQKKSNCLSVIPVETELGRKTQIHQPSCNHDLTCLEGDCPSFFTIETTAQRADVAYPEPPDDLADPEVSDRDEVGVYIVGIGGTGVVSVTGLLAEAAAREGGAVSGMDQTGLSQKGGSVVSHLRVRRGTATPPLANSIGTRGSDVYVALDVLTAAHQDHLSRIDPERTSAVVSAALTPTISMITQPMEEMPRPDELAQRIERRAADTIRCDARSIAEQLFGDDMPANVLMLGVVSQAGLLPVSAATIEQTLVDRGRGSGGKNLAAFRWGRTFVARPDLVDSALRDLGRSGSSLRQPSEHADREGDRLLEGCDLPESVRAVVDWRVRDLVDYESVAGAEEYVRTVQAANEAERRVLEGDTRFSEAVATYLYKLMAYKDEYEVARLYLGDDSLRKAREAFPGDARIMLHPPVMRALGMKRKLRLRPTTAFLVFRALRSMRRLRGTPFDPFGLARVRRVERRLLREYRERVERLLPLLSPETYETAVEIASLPDLVRGYEGVKLANVSEYDEAVIEAERALGAGKRQSGS